MAAELPSHCARCQRPAPALEDDEFSDWEAIGDGDEIICPGCLTREEWEEIAEEESAYAVTQCARCARPVDSDPEKFGEWTDVSAGDGERVVVCPACLTAEDHAEMAADFQRFAEEGGG